MLIEAISLRGYCRTFRPPKPASLGKRIGNTAFDPAMRITKLTTIASTGRLMKRSVNDFILEIRNPKQIRTGDATPSSRLRLEGEPTPFFRHSTFVLRHSPHVS